MRSFEETEEIDFATESILSMEPIAGIRRQRGRVVSGSDPQSGG